MNESKKLTVVEKLLLNELFNDRKLPEKDNNKIIIKTNLSGLPVRVLRYQGDDILVDVKLAYVNGSCNCHLMKYNIDNINNNVLRKFIYNDNNDMIYDYIENVHFSFERWHLFDKNNKKVSEVDTDHSHVDYYYNRNELLREIVYSQQDDCTTFEYNDNGTIKEVNYEWMYSKYIYDGDVLKEIQSYLAEYGRDRDDDVLFRIETYNKDGYMTSHIQYEDDEDEFDHKRYTGIVEYETKIEYDNSNNIISQTINGVKVPYKYIYADQEDYIDIYEEFRKKKEEE